MKKCFAVFVMLFLFVAQVVASPIVLETEELETTVTITTKVESVTVTASKVTITILKAVGSDFGNSSQRMQIVLDGDEYAAFIASAGIDFAKVKTFVESVPQEKKRPASRLPRF